MDVLAVRDVRGARGRAGAARQVARAHRGAHLPLPRPLDARPRGAVYRTKEEVEREKLRDPIALFAERCVKRRRARPRPTSRPSRRRSTTRWTRRWRSPRPRPEPPAGGAASPTCTRTSAMAVMTYREALNLALREEMRRDPRVFVIGRGGRPLRGRLQGDAGAAQGVRRAAHHRHADRGVRLHRRRRRRGHDRAAARRRDDDVQLLDPGPRPDRQPRGQDTATCRAASTTSRSSSAGPAGPPPSSPPSTRRAWRRTSTTCPGSRSCGRRRPADAKGLLKSAIRDDNPVIFIESETLYAIKGEVPEDPTSRSRSAWPSSGARAPTSPWSPTWA